MDQARYFVKWKARNFENSSSGSGFDVGIVAVVSQTRSQFKLTSQNDKQAESILKEEDA